MSCFFEAETNPLLKNIYTFLKASYGDTAAELRMVELGFTFDSALSTVRTKVWFDKTRKRPLILHRGSIDLFRNFFVSDTLILFNYHQIDPRMFEARRITKATKNKYGTSVCDHVGHSMGGMCSEMVADADSYVVTYNKAANLQGLDKQIIKRQTDIRNKNDLVSVLSKYQDRNVITLEKNCI